MSSTDGRRPEKCHWEEKKCQIHSCAEIYRERKTWDVFTWISTQLKCFLFWRGSSIQWWEVGFTGLYHQQETRVNKSCGAVGAGCCSAAQRLHEICRKQLICFSCLYGILPHQILVFTHVISWEDHGNKQKLAHGRLAVKVWNNKQRNLVQTYYKSWKEEAPKTKCFPSLAL